MGSELERDAERGAEVLVVEDDAGSGETLLPTVRRYCGRSKTS